MPLIVNTNVTSMNAQRHLGFNTNALTKSMEKLASGFRINRASDDAAGLQLSENLRAQIKGSKKAYDNVQDGINVLNIADGAMQTMTDNLQRVRELAVQAGNDTYAQPQRDAIVQEIEQLLADNDRIADGTTFNGVALLSDLVPANFFVQVGANSDQGAPADLNRIDIASALVDMTSDNATVNSYGDFINNIYTGAGTVAITDNPTAQTVIGEIDSALAEVNSRRGNLGALVNRLEGTANNLQISIENLSSSESRIRNVDVAAESANLVRNQILQQSSATILAQANQVPSLALQLLQG